jgi:hypothetical protein
MIFSGSVNVTETTVTGGLTTELVPLSSTVAGPVYVENLKVDKLSTSTINGVPCSKLLDVSSHQELGEKNGYRVQYSQVLYLFISFKFSRSSFSSFLDEAEISRARD